MASDTQHSSRMEGKPISGSHTRKTSKGKEPDPVGVKTASHQGAEGAGRHGETTLSPAEA